MVIDTVHSNSSIALHSNAITSTDFCLLDCLENVYCRCYNSLLLWFSLPTSLLQVDKVRLLSIRGIERLVAEYVNEGTLNAYYNGPPDSVLNELLRKHFVMFG